jgi:radical SAM protein with 4Fe4S-binding SPASM domain
VKKLRILSLSPTGKAKAQFGTLELTDDDVSILNADLASINQKTKIDISMGFCTSQNLTCLNILEGHEQCFAAENRVHIDTFGNVFPCTASSGRLVFSAGNLQVKENSLSSIWSTSPLLQFLRDFHLNPPKKCSTCDNHIQCMSGCRVKMSFKYKDVTIANPECGGPYNNRTPKKEGASK